MRTVSGWPILLVALVATGADAAGPPALVLEKVVMLSRHGIRSPLRSTLVLETLSGRSWPKWPVAAGQMTQHGERDLALMGDYLRARSVERGVLPASGCPAARTVDVWADAADARTRRSGEILADRLAPGCGIVSAHAAAADPLFDAGGTDACPVGWLAASRAMLAAARENGEMIRPEDRRALEALQGVLAPHACDPGATGVCLVPAANASTLQSAAKLTLGATIAEAIYLQYVQGLSPGDLDWVQTIDARTIDAIMPLHDRGLDIRKRTPLLAARRGALMARTIVAFLAGHALPSGAPLFDPAARLVMIAGHDSNLLYMGALLGLDWRLPDQPSATAPDTTLVLELWRDPTTSQRSLRVAITAQTLQQLRDGSPLGATNPPDVVPIVPDACTGASGCPIESFAAWVDRRIASLCGG